MIVLQRTEWMTIRSMWKLWGKCSMIIVVEWIRSPKLKNRHNTIFDLKGEKCVERFRRRFSRLTQFFSSENVNTQKGRNDLDGEKCGSDPTDETSAGESTLFDEIRRVFHLLFCWWQWNARSVKWRRRRGRRTRKRERGGGEKGKRRGMALCSSFEIESIDRSKFIDWKASL